jgi:hypothetical protein
MPFNAVMLVPQKTDVGALFFHALDDRGCQFYKPCGLQGLAGTFKDAGVETQPVSKLFSRYPFSLT